MSLCHIPLAGCLLAASIWPIVPLSYPSLRLSLCHRPLADCLLATPAG
jgi:hypothetical protein